MKFNATAKAGWLTMLQCNVVDGSTASMKSVCFFQIQGVKRMSQVTKRLFSILLAAAILGGIVGYTLIELGF